MRSEKRSHEHETQNDCPQPCGPGRRGGLQVPVRDPALVQRRGHQIQGRDGAVQFIEKYPQSPFTSDARFLRIDCLYRATYRWELDQTPTKACLATITEYLTEYPADGPHVEACVKMIDDLRDRLDRKEFENARLYYKMEDYLAARVALRNVLKDNAENGYREDILYYTAMASYHYARMSVPAKQKERYLVFVDDYLNFIGENPESKYRRELDAMYRRSQRALGRYDGIDEELDLKAKDFERERKAIEKEKEGEKNN